MSRGEHDEKTKGGLTRRTAVRAGVVATAAAMGIPTLRAMTWLNQPAGDELKVLSNDEYQIVQAIAEAMFPPNAGLPMSGSEADVGRRFDDQLVWFDRDSGRLLRVLLHLIDDSAVAWDALATPFSWRPLDERVDILTSWNTTDNLVRRTTFSSLKLFLGMHYNEHSGVLQHFGIGYVCDGAGS